jgi:DNA-binding response OmpR family regulator
MRIAIACTNATFRHSLVEGLRARGDHDVVAVDDERQLLECVASRPPPAALVVDANALGSFSLEVCSQIRASSAGSEPHILVVADSDSPEESGRWLRAGADDVLGGPVPPDVLLARLSAVPLRSQRRDASAKAALDAALLDAEREANGELVVREPGSTARIYLHEARIAWINVTGRPVSLADLLPADSGIDDALVQTVIEECRTRRARLSETLLRWGLTDRPRLREAMRRWLSSQLATVRGFEAPHALFLPQTFEYADDLLFSSSELAGADAPAPPPPQHATFTEVSLQKRSWEAAFLRPLQPPERARHLVATCSALDGAFGVAVLDRTSGLCLGSWGAGLNPELAWFFVRGLGKGAERAADLVTTLDGCHHVIRAWAAAPDWAVYVVVDGARARLAKAQVELRLLLERCDASGEPRAP